MNSSYLSLFRGITRGILPYLPPVPRTDAQASLTPDCGLTALSGVIEISSLRDEC